MSSEYTETEKIELEKLKQELALRGVDYVLVPLKGEEASDEFKHMKFTGEHKGEEVLFDALIYTLRLQHASELYEIAEHRAAQRFPDFRRIRFEEDENGNLACLDELEEEIGLFIAEQIMELESRGDVLVREHVYVDECFECGVGLEVGLNRERITEAVIQDFVDDFKSGKLMLDSSSYSFGTEDI
ncbi:MAG: hypothetical protein MI784_03220 [Cytophagales bacterium]|nr:hypothetical protein [Cytophagales bacterium]